MLNFRLPVLMILLIQSYLCVSHSANENRVWKIEFEGGLEFELKSPANWTGSLSDPKDRVADVKSGTEVVFYGEGYEIIITAKAAPKAWSGQDLLDFELSEIKTIENGKDLRIDEQDLEVKSFSNSDILGFYRRFELENDYSGKKLIVYLGGFVLDRSWVMAMFSTSAEDPAAPDPFFELPARLSVSRTINSEYYIDPSSPRFLLATKLK